MDTIKVEPCSFCSTQNNGSPTNLRISLAKHLIYNKIYKENKHINHIFNEDKYFTEKWKKYTD